jgi:hypothetical protein
MADRESKTALFDEFARVANALASGRRIELLDVLANGERTVDALAREVGLSVANTSQHLRFCVRPGWSPVADTAPQSITGWPDPRYSSPGGPCGAWPPAGRPRSSGWLPLTLAPEMN